MMHNRVVSVFLLVLVFVFTSQVNGGCNANQYTQSYTQSSSGGQPINIAWNEIHTPSGWFLQDALWGLNTPDNPRQGVFSNTIYQCPDGSMGINYNRGTTNADEPIYPSLRYDFDPPLLLSQLTTLHVDMDVTYTHGPCPSHQNYDLAWDIWTTKVPGDAWMNPLDEVLIMYNWCALGATPSTTITSAGTNYKYVNKLDYPAELYPSGQTKLAWREDIYAIQPGQQQPTSTIDLVPFFKDVQTRWNRGDFYVWSIQIGVEAWNSDYGSMTFGGMQIRKNGGAAFAKFGSFASSNPPTSPPATSPPATSAPSTCTQSASGATVNAGSTAYLCDANNKRWTITSTGLIAVNGVVDTDTANVLQIAYVNGVIWQKNNQNLWWRWTSGAWSPPYGQTTSPLTTPTPAPPTNGPIPSIAPVTASPTVAWAGQSTSVSISFTFRNSATAYSNVHVGVSLAPPENPDSKICEVFAPLVNVAANTNYPYTLTCTIPSNTPAGTYNVNPGVWVNDWSTSIAWISGPTTVVVKNAAAYITPAAISKTTVSRGSSFTVTIGVTAGSTAITNGFVGYSMVKDSSSSTIPASSNTGFSVNLAAGAYGTYTYTVAVPSSSSAAPSGAYHITMGLWNNAWAGLDWINSAYSISIN